MLVATPRGARVLVVQNRLPWLYISLAARHACYFGAQLRTVASCPAVSVLMCRPAWWLAAKLDSVWFMSCLSEQQGIYRVIFKRKGG
jgi:hypothetical protein